MAGSLRAGDVLVLSNGELVTVEWVQHEILESPIKVYNFEVEDFHTYFVGECGVLVHNDCDDFDTWLSKGDSDNSVYFGKIDGDYKYTGITKQSKKARLQQHNYAPTSKSKSKHMSKNFDDLDIQTSGLTRNQARAIEQYYIENGPNELNKINSISNNHRYYDKANECAEKYIVDYNLPRF